MRWILLTLLLAGSFLYADCPDAKYLPSGYTTGMRIDFRKIGVYLERNGIDPQDLRFFQQPGSADGEKWLKDLQYTDVESVLVLTREREKDLIALVCFPSKAALSKIKRKLLAERKRVEEKSGKKFKFDEKTGEAEIDGGDVTFFSTTRSFVFGDAAAVTRYKANYREKKSQSSGLVGRLNESKAAIMISVDARALGKQDTRDLPDFAGLREIAAGTRAIEMQASLKDRPLITLGMVMKNAAMARRVSALFNVFKELGIQFSGNVHDRDARKALTSLLGRMQFRPKGRRAELSLKLNKLEQALLIAWIQNEISQSKERHANYQLALKQEEYCSDISAGRFKAEGLAKIKDINLRSSAGNYLLHCAASAGNAELVKAMLKRGAKADLLNQKDETAYDAAMNARQYALALSLLQRKEQQHPHEGLVALAKSAQEFRISSQAEGRKALRLKTALVYGEDTISTPEFTLADGSKTQFEFPWDKDNPLVHPARDGAVYDVVFTFDAFMQADKPASDGEESDGEESEAEKDDSQSLTGILVSATDPEYKAPAAEPAATEPNSENDDSTSYDSTTESEVSPPVDEFPEE